MRFPVVWDTSSDDDDGDDPNAPPDGIYEIPDDEMLGAGLTVGEDGKFDEGEAIDLALDILSDREGYCASSCALAACDLCNGEGRYTGIGNRDVNCEKCGGSGVWP